MSLPPQDLSMASYAILGHEQFMRPTTQVVRPQPASVARLLRLQDDARQTALIAPETFAHPEVSRALEQTLVHAMINCLAADTPIEVGRRWRHHSAIISRFEDFLAANCDRAMHLPEICAAVHASERTLRACCEEHLGMGPMRFLWLRRMHFARRALILGDPAKTTVTRTATEYGFWELGRLTSAGAMAFVERAASRRRET